MAFSQQVGAQDYSAAVSSLLAQDMRLAAVAERLQEANADLCRETMPLTGLVIHSRDQYAADAAAGAFENGTIAIAGVLDGSPASVAGLSTGDGLAAVGETETSGLHREGEAPLRDAAFDVLAELAPQKTISLRILRDGVPRVVELPVRRGCRALVEIRAESGFAARSDGRVIQINHGLAAAATDEQLAVVFAHELAHVVLEHRRRLSTAGVSKGFFGEFGRNQQLNRQVEVEADRISVHLLANAGYDPAIAPAFWRTDLGRRAGGGVLHSRIYPSPEARARLLEREIADYMPQGPSPSYPGHLLARRTVPFAP